MTLAAQIEMIRVQARMALLVARLSKRVVAK